MDLFVTIFLVFVLNTRIVFPQIMNNQPYQNQTAAYIQEYIECPTSELCLNGGTCYMEVNKKFPLYYCKCRDYFYGEICQFQRTNQAQFCQPEVRENFCMNGGTCYVDNITNDTTLYYCQCSKKFWGTRCESMSPSQLQPCSEELGQILCLNEGTCYEYVMDGENHFFCACTPEYIGHDCEFKVVEDNSSTTLNELLCLNEGVSNRVLWEDVEIFGCSCQQGFYGDRCEYMSTAISALCSDKDLNFCLNGGTCYEEVFPYKKIFYCSCMAGYTGERCEISLSSESQACQDLDYKFCANGGTCFQQSYLQKTLLYCQCTYQFAGARCEKKLPRESICPPPLNKEICENNGTCLSINTGREQGAYMCKCAEGYYGATCEYRQPLQPMHSVCPEEVLQFFCHNGGTCYKDIIMNRPFYYCECLKPFTGVRCEINIVKWQRCPPPLDKELCARGGVCSQVTTHFPHLYFCQCKENFFGARCEHCFQGAHIEDHLCPTPLDKVLCKNSGTCVQVKISVSSSAYFCACPEGLYGTSCEYPYPALALTDICPSDMVKTFCLNGGTCYKEEVSGYTVYMCECVYPYTGERCELMSIQTLNCPPEFNNILCLNGGICTYRVSNGYRVYVCECTERYFGIRCEHCIRHPKRCPEEFKNKLCQNGGECVETVYISTLISIYYCKCLNGFFGTLCEYPHSSIEITSYLCPEDIAGKYCEHGGTCYTSRLNGEPTYYCLCPEDYYGVTCEFPYPSTECPENMAQICLHGTCFRRQSNGVNSYQCVCNQGFYGDRCEHQEQNLIIGSVCPLEEPELCKNNGTCIKIMHQARFLLYCKCPRGFYGTVCQYPFHPGLTKHEPCRLDTAESYCLNGGTCYRTDINGKSVSLCECIEPYYGARCEYKLPFITDCKPPFDRILCMYGRCTQTVSHGQIIYSCRCTAGFYGARCEHFSETVQREQCTAPMLNSLCGNGGTCVTVTKDKVDILYFCKCKDKFYGMSCEYRKPQDNRCPAEIENDWCLHGGTCFAEYKMNRLVYRCECTSPFYGARCEKHSFIQLYCPPSMQQSLCYNGGSCIPITVGRDTIYYCKCINQYYGSRCEYCEELVEVDVCPSHLNRDLCKNGGTCITIKGPNEKSIYYCRCPEGIYGLSCEYPYPHIATVGRPCPACLDETYCLHGGTCYRGDIMGNSVYHCECLNPYHGERCEVIHPQQVKCPNQFNYFFCLNSGTCVQSKSNGHTIHICICQDGYYGPRCEHTCGQTENPAELCEEPFSTELCKNGGTCVSVKYPEDNELLFCKCEAWAFGTSCEYPFLPVLQEHTLCPPDVSKYFCLNGGTCFKDVDAGDTFYYCSCPDTYFGERCELYIPGQILCPTSSFELENKLCLNGGTCVQQQTHSYHVYLCLCPPGYYGPRCEYGKHTIESSSTCPSPIDKVLCMNGGTCTVHVTENNQHIYFCTCAEDYYGMICEHKIPPSTLAGEYCPLLVAENWCRNGGTCYQGSVEGIIVYYCDCVEPFYGARCELIRPGKLLCPRVLDKFLCVNGGVCSRRFLSKRVGFFYYCDCPLGYSGARCEMSTLIEINVEYCGSNSFCNGYGICLEEVIGRYLHCDCYKKRYGEKCQLITGVQEMCPPEYEGHICFNGGTCWLGKSLRWTTPYCECAEGYMGQQCEFTKPEDKMQCPNEINSYLCLNGGSCFVKRNNQQHIYYCECPEEYFGLRCEYNSPNADSCDMPYFCLNFGTCYSFKFSYYTVYFCVCEPGYHGSLCQYSMQFLLTRFLCPPKIAEWFCHNGGTCFRGTINNNADYYCVCPDEFVGHRCQYEASTADHCTGSEVTSFCKNGGTCKKVFDGPTEIFYFCVCLDGYGGRRCNYLTHKIDRCPVSLETSFCLNNGTCKVLIFAGYVIYYCECTEGFYGPRCEEIFPAELQDLECPENINQHICLNGGTCIRKIIAKLEIYECRCLDDFWGDRCEYTYDDARNCTEPFYKYYCLNGGTCNVLTVGKAVFYHCECLKNFFGARCESHIPLVGPESERCVGEIDTYFCLNEGTCYQLVVNNEVFYFCICPEGWAGLRCEDGPVTKESCPSELKEEYCLNGGTCFKLQVGIQELYYCKCAKGYEGTRCEYNLPNTSNCSAALSSMYCLNGGTCSQVTVLGETLYLCDCPEGFWGKQCEFNTFIRNFCPPIMNTAFCLNGGTCYQLLVDDKDLYYCVCTNNYYGMRCENSYLASHETQPCKPIISAEICLNGGSCYETNEYGPKLFYCECADGYSGKRCEHQNMGYLHASYVNMQHNLERSTSSLQMEISFFLLFLWSTLCYKTMF